MGVGDRFISLVTLSQAMLVGHWKCHIPDSLCGAGLCWGRCVCMVGADAVTSWTAVGGQGRHPGACPQPRGVQSEPVSVQSLMDCILESFAFLNADLASDELSLFGGSQAPE